jgi:hypothetical protein
MILVLLFSTIASAEPREMGERPGTRPLCHRAEMNACIENHRAAARNELAAIAAIDGKILLLSRDREVLQRESRALESEARKAEVTAQMSERESADTMVSSLGEPIFSAGPRAEEIFFLKGEANSWQERHSPERRARLNTLAESSRKKSAQFSPLRQNLAMEIGALDALNASLLGERDQRGQQVKTHADMCDRSCKIEFCRDD